MPPRPVRPAKGAVQIKKEAAKEDKKPKAKAKSAAAKKMQTAGLLVRASLHVSALKGTANVFSTVKKTAKRVDSTTLEEARCDLARATCEVMNTRAMLVPLRKELKKLRPKSQHAVKDHRMLERDVANHKREMDELRERYHISVEENSDQKDLLRGGEEEIENMIQVVKDATQTTAQMEVQRGKLMSSIISERKRVEILTGETQALEGELKELGQDHSFTKKNLKDTEAICVELQTSIERARKQVVEVNIDLCNALKKKHSMNKKISKRERARTALKEELARLEGERLVKDRTVGNRCT